MSSITNILDLTRIERIALATDEWFREDGNSYSRKAWNDKFAAFILADCINIVNIWSEETPCSAGYDIFTVSKIKEHFGIKEYINES